MLGMDYIIVKSRDDDGGEIFLIAPRLCESLIVDLDSVKAACTTLTDAVVSLELWRSTLPEYTEGSA